jgi:tetratricopeptide (TPR) repeat protein
MGDALLRLGRPEEAAKAFDAALRRRRGHHESRVGLISAMLKTRPPEEASGLLEEALQARPDDPKLLLLAATQARAMGQSAAAMDYASRCLEHDPSSVEALVLRAQLAHQAGRPSDAHTDAEAALGLDPNHLAALNVLAQSQALLGDRDGSRATMARHKQVLARSEQMRRLTIEIDERPEDPEPRWKLGQVAAEAGLGTLAEQSFRAALAIDPNCGPARQGLATLTRGSTTIAPSSLAP